MPLLLNPHQPNGDRQAKAAKIANSIAKGGKEELESAFLAVMCKLEDTNPRRAQSADAREAAEHIEFYADDHRSQADYMRRVSLMGVVLMLDDEHLDELAGMAEDFARSLNGGKPS